MDSKKRKSRFKFVRRISSKRMTKEEYEKSEKILARLVARAYAADHPEQFGNLEGLHHSKKKRDE